MIRSPSDRKRHREAMARMKAREERLQELEAAIIADVRSGMTQSAIAAKHKLARDTVRLISQRLQAEGRLTAYAKEPRKPDEVWHEVDDARASETLTACGVSYPSVPDAEPVDLVFALRNGAAARPLVYGGSVAGACADAGVAS